MSHENFNTLANLQKDMLYWREKCLSLKIDLQMLQFEYDSVLSNKKSKDLAELTSLQLSHASLQSTLVATLQDVDSISSLNLEYSKQLRQKDEEIDKLKKEIIEVKER